MFEAAGPEPLQYMMMQAEFTWMGLLHLLIRAADDMQRAAFSRTHGSLLLRTLVVLWGLGHHEKQMLLKQHTVYILLLLAHEEDPRGESHGLGFRV
jgi:hypothetical protein